MRVLSDIFKHKRNYRQCVMADVSLHFDKIRHWIPEAEADHFQERMKDCVEDGNAWCLNDAFLYYRKENVRMAHGVALFGQDNMLDLLSLFIGVFSFEDNDTHLMRFRLHPGKLMEEYKAFLTIISMKRNHQNPEHPLMVRVDDFRRKIVHLLNMSDIKR